MKKLCFGVGGTESPKGEKVYSCIDEIIKKTAQRHVSFPQCRAATDSRSATAWQIREREHTATHVRRLQ